jgi:GNAT superfamily N-acetyltransferase
MTSERALMSTCGHGDPRSNGARAGAPVGARVRVLRRADDLALRVHFAALTPDDLRMRFCHSAAPEVLDSYIARILSDGTVSFGVFDGSLALAGTAQLAVNGGVAELGVSVLEQHRHAGIGSALVEHAADYARLHHARIITLHCLAENLPIIRLARHAGMAVTFDRGEADAFLFLAAPAHSVAVPDWPMVGCLATVP